MTPFTKLCAIGFFAFLSYTLARFPVIPLYAESLNLSPQQIGLVVAASTITGVFFKMPSGILSDILGRKKMMLLGVCFFAFSPLLYFFSKGAMSLFFVRIIHGFATAIFGPTISSVISHIASEKNRGQLLSTYSAVNMLGRTIGPMLGGWLLFWGGFAYPFIASAVAGMVALLIYLTWFLTWSNEPKPVTNSVRSDFFKLFLKGLKEVISNKAILAISFVECLQYLATGGLECFLPIYLKKELNYLEWQIGLLFSVQVIAIMFSKPFLGVLSDKIGRKPQIIVGLIIGGISYSFIPFINNSFLLVASLIAIYGLAIAIVTSATSAFVTDLSSKSNYGAAHGVFGTIMDTGHASGPILGGLLITFLNYKYLFLIFGSILIISSFLFNLALKSNEKIKIRS